MAQALADNAIDGVFSYAGRTCQPQPQPLPTRVGGFGGVTGLVAWLTSEKITHVIDATHPFAKQISTHVIEACARLKRPLLGLERPPWSHTFSVPWHRYPDFESLVVGLPKPSHRIFLAIGRTQLHHFHTRAQHTYLVRLVDAPQAPLPFPHHQVVIGRGPFTPAEEIALMRTYGIQAIVSKNSGGTGGQAKLLAAEHLGLPVYIVERPTYPSPRNLVSTVDEALSWLADHG